jgi:hypothetical protein
MRDAGFLLKKCFRNVCISILKMFLQLRIAFDLTRNAFRND